ncbi:MAG TPA: rhodanese-like domain-containing protein [Thermomicrobiaceae bacterium]|nr:rhodanese-like domain-containing protein [Thermomicrobiaceae bacterium]
MIQAMPPRPEVPEIAPTDAWARAQQGEAVIVDVREPEEVAEIAVPGAIHIPLGELDRSVDRIPTEREILFLCRSGNRSAFATEFFRRRVHARAANVTGGIIAWWETGLPTSMPFPRD